MKHYFLFSFESPANSAAIILLGYVCIYLNIVIVDCMLLLMMGTKHVRRKVARLPAIVCLFGARARSKKNKAGQTQNVKVYRLIIPS